MNDLTFTDASTVLTGIFEQATGQKIQAPTTPGEFVAVAQTALKTGYDPIMNAIGQVLSRTIFSIRPYYAKFRDLNRSEIQFGNHVRKINYGSTGGVDRDEAFFGVEDGVSIDMYKIREPKVVQTNFYGVVPISKYITRFNRQLKVAFQSWEDLNRFWAGVFNEIMNDLTQIHESTARQSLANFMAGISAGRPTGVIHLLSEYNTLTGNTYTKDELMGPAVFSDFVRWMYSRINTISDAMTDRTVNFHTQLPGITLLRHTPKNRQIMYLSAPLLNQIDATVMSTTFHNGMLRLGGYEAVNYWQSPDKPDSINVTPTYMDATGALVTPSAAVELDNIVGIIFDDEAIGYTTVDRESGTTPYNIAGSYWNIYYKFNDRYWNDFSENGVVLCLD